MACTCRAAQAAALTTSSPLSSSTRLTILFSPSIFHHLHPRSFHASAHRQRRSGEALLRDRTALDGTDLSKIPKSRLWLRDIDPKDREIILAHRSSRNRSRTSPASFASDPGAVPAATPWEERLAQLRATNHDHDHHNSHIDSHNDVTWLPRDNRRRAPPLSPAQKEANRSLPDWAVQKAALQHKFPEGWRPLRRLSPDAMEGIRALHRQFPAVYTTPVLANKFAVSPEAIRRILSASWTPSADEEVRRQERWLRRGESVWARYSALGIKPPRRWRDAMREEGGMGEYDDDHDAGAFSGRRWTRRDDDGGDRAQAEEGLDLQERIGANLF